ncbi:alpha/beta fold hydrolase [Qipengyuania sp. GH29]|nr:alpha/beta fold hydrolase [Qipengyuania sphaerica]
MAAQEELRVTHDGLMGDLAGTLLGDLDETRKLVLIIPGSGPTDRDGNNPLGVKAAPYRLLAEALAEHGIASVRIDKRGMAGSKNAVVNANDVTVEDYVDDVEAWTRQLAERSSGECIWVLGHSEGGLIAMAAAARDPVPYCGLVLVAAPGRNLSEIIRTQIAANPMAEPLLPQVDDIIARLSAGETVPAEDIHPGLLPLFGPQVQGLISSLFRQNPSELLASHELPVLILNGDKDIQTPDEDAELLASSRSDAQLVVLPGVNHVLKRVEGDDREANIATYADPDLPLAPGVADAIVQFIDQAS